MGIPLYAIFDGDKNSIFYSWQSDTVENMNRYFIEKALKNAINKLPEKFNLEKRF